ncbi:MAG: hypothetical protein MnENMB40S_33570 [Rhizobiaceae bacterium MnEN-MB40S]|nr:MAG: hypothetical protein MnENMB40S_33570 [Rhizobiaceae bacterium MnEN-MB40S]
MSLSLQQIENEVPKFASDNVNLSVVCQRLLRKPIDALSVEELRILIGQDIGLEHLLPIAFALLERNPMVSGDLFDGDLLYAVVHCSRASAPHNKNRIASLCSRAIRSCKASKRAELMMASALRNKSGRAGDPEAEYRKSIHDELAKMPWDSFLRYSSGFASDVQSG